MESKKQITVQVELTSSIQNAWENWTNPKHITQWNYASDEWHCPTAINDLRSEGKFNFRMESKNGKEGFDFTGTYTNIIEHDRLEYILDDGRKVTVLFEELNNITRVTEIFEIEDINSAELQKSGWQSILNNYKKHVEQNNMKTIKFNQLINASTEKVYNTLLNDETYRKWTSAFNPSSYFKGEWTKGSKILFIGTDENGVEGGMVSIIRENIPNCFVSIEHLGIYQNGEEITSGAAVESWAGSLENYSLQEENGKTRIEVEMDSNDDFKNYFEETWPKALHMLKQLCEE